jgi:hypothetical protein
MPKIFIISFSALGLAALTTVFTVPAAQAAIVCKDGFQNSGGNWISTPYCNDAHLANVARKHGASVSDDEIRNNPGKKDEICRFVGSDPEVSIYCPDSGGQDDGP